MQKKTSLRCKWGSRSISLILVYTVQQPLKLQGSPRNVGQLRHLKLNGNTITKDSRKHFVDVPKMEYFIPGTKVILGEGSDGRKKSCPTFLGEGDLSSASDCVVLDTMYVLRIMWYHTFCHLSLDVLSNAKLNLTKCINRTASNAWLRRECNNTMNLRLKRDRPRRPDPFHRRGILLAPSWRRFESFQDLSQTLVFRLEIVDVLVSQDRNDERSKIGHVVYRFCFSR